MKITASKALVWLLSLTLTVILGADTFIRPILQTREAGTLNNLLWVTKLVDQH